MENTIKEILILIKEINTNSIPPPLDYSGAISSIASLVISSFSLVILLRISRKIKNKNAIKYIMKEMDRLHEILKKPENEIPSDIKNRLTKTVDDIKKYKNIFFKYQLKQLIRESHETNPNDFEDMKRIISLVINELKEEV